MAGLFRRSPGDPQRARNAAMAKEFRRLVKAGKYDRALRAGDEYLAAVPGNHDVLFAVGAIHHMRGRHRRAVSYFDRALDIGGYDVEVLLLKARSHRSLGEGAEAARCCKKILEVDPDNGPAAEMLAHLS